MDLYVDKMPKNCKKCYLSKQSYVSDNKICIINPYADIRCCPLKSLADHDKSVIENIKKQNNDICKELIEEIVNYNCIIYGYIPKEYILELIEKIQKGGIECLRKN